MAGFLPKSVKPNFLLVVLDDIWPYQYRQFHSGTPYDGDNPQNDAFDASGVNLYANTPWLDNLSATGVTFLNSYGNPVCGADRSSLLTGVTTPKHGIGTIPTIGGIAESLNSDVAFEHPLLSTVLKAEGYTCGIIGKYHLVGYDNGGGAPSLETQFSHSETVGDFDDVRVTFHNLAANNGPTPSGGGGGDNYNYFVYRNGTVSTVQSVGTGWADHTDAEFSVKVQADDAIAMIAGAGGEPWLCYLAFNAPHNPFDKPTDDTLVNTTEYLQPGVQGTAWHNFQAQLEAMDTELQRVQDSMSAAEWSRTTVIFTADNGFLDDILSSAKTEGKDVGSTGDSLLGFHTSDTPRFKNSPYEGGTRVPLIIGGAGVAGGRSTEAMFHVTDIFATVVTAAGGTLGTIDGIDQGPVLKGTQSEVRTTSFCMRYFPNGDPADYETDWGAGGVRDIAYIETFASGKFKYVEALREFETTLEMYQLTNSSGDDVDPWELNDIWDEGAFLSQRNALIASVAAEVSA